MPTLTPFEAWIALDKVPGFWEREGCDGGATDPYPMDYYDREGGEWNSTYHRKAAASGSRANFPRVLISSDSVSQQKPLEVGNPPCACGKP